MKTYFSAVFSVFTLLFSLRSSAQKEYQVLEVPAGKQYTHIDTRGTTVLPSGRYLTPAGSTIQITHDPFGMALSPDGTKIVTLHNGVFSIISSSSLEVVRVPSYDKKIISPLSNGSFLGVAFSPDSKTVYLSGGDNGAVIVYDIEKLQRIDSISLNGTVDSVDYEDSFTSDLLLNENNHELLVLDRGNFRMVRIDLNTRKITTSIKTGRQPFGLSISPDHTIAFEANVGMYDYPLLPDLTEKNYDSLLLPFHPYGNDTKESVEGYSWHGRKIPGVGSPLAPEAMSVYSIDLGTNKVIDKFKPGHQIGQMVEGAEVVGGASPNSLAVGNKYAYVTNATNDNISVIDYRNHTIIGHIPIKVNSLIDKYRGLLPFGIALSKNEKTLYVALLGFNAIAVIDAESGRTKGLIPTGWGPTKVILSKDEKDIYAISCRGYGAGPNGGRNFVAPVQGTYIGDIQLASFQKIPMPDSNKLAQYTKQAIANTFIKNLKTDDGKNPLPALQGIRKSPIKYIVYITKENRTYDEMLGQLRTGIGDSSLARFGVGVNVIAKDKTLYHINVSPNHLKVASQFA